jgi:ParB-like chromosome segregation protein Spo0J
MRSKPKPKQPNLETFTIVKMKRSELHANPYNPRTITKQARDKLAKGLKRHGLVQPVVWNKRTGRLVGGHQRLDIMDSIMVSKLPKQKNPSKTINIDYELQVAVIDVDEAKEQEIAILLNAEQAMGGWDTEKMAKVFKEFDLSLDGIGFDKLDLAMMIDDEQLAPLTQEVGAGAAAVKEVGEQVDHGLKAVKAAREVAREKMAKKNRTDFFVAFVFGSEEEKRKTMALLGQGEDERYLDGSLLLEVIELGKKKRGAR